MKKVSTVKKRSQDELRPHYDFKELGPGVRGKYFERYKAGTNIALLAPDVRAAFPTDDAVNEALRTVMASKKTKK
jgi:hypothetical protein